MGRESKLPKFLEQMRELLNDPTSVILTNKEIWVAVNYELDRADKVSYHTFERWLVPSSPTNYTKHESLTPEQIAEFGELLDFSKVKQKMSLAKEMLDPDTKNKWGASWILERKFPDLKMNQSGPADSTTNIKITVGSEGHKDLIEGILAGSGNDTKDISHEEVDETIKLEENNG